MVQLVGLLFAVLAVGSSLSVGSGDPAGNAALKCRATNVGEHGSRGVHCHTFAARHFSAASGRQTVAPASDAVGLVFLVRHAERADAGMEAAKVAGADPELSEAGLARANALAMLLKDAKITAILTTKFRRTRDTAQPLAKAAGIAAVVIDPMDAAGLVDKVKAAAGNVLIVGHTNTVPDAIKALGVTEPVTIGDDEFDNLFVVIRGAKPTLLRLHYR
jgi:phosphohistidine phosphatase SixA